MSTAEAERLEVAVARVEPEALSVADEARAFTITDAATMEAAGEFLRLRVKAALRQIDEAIDPFIKDAHQLHKRHMERKKALAEPLLEAERTLKLAIAEYHTVQLEKQRAEERRLAELARKEAERVQLEAAAKLEAAGQQEAAQQVLEAPVVVAPVPRPAAPPPAAPKGVSVRRTFAFRITDPSKIKPDYMVPHEQAIGAIVRTLGQKAVEVVGPGIEVFEESVVSSRSR